MYFVEDLLVTSRNVSNIEMDEQLIEYVEYDTTALIIYTSGSSRIPIGVLISHTKLLQWITWQWQKFPTTGKPMGAGKTSPLFLDFYTEFLTCLLGGWPLVVILEQVSINPELLITVLEDFHVTKMVLVPTLLKVILEYAKSRDIIPDLNMVICSGEVPPDCVAT